ncbi:MAG: hypothetical protein U0640_09770 [Phycisphaerales bacterium]
MTLPCSQRLTLIRQLCCTAALIAAAGLPLSAHAQVGPFTGSDELDLSAINFPPGERTDFPTFVTDDGKVFGYSTITYPSGLAGFLSWTVTPGTPAIELALSGPQYTDSDGFRLSFSNATNASGFAAGATTRAGSGGLGADAWVFNGQSIAPIGLSLADVGQTPETAYDLGNFSYKISASGDVLGGAFVQRGDGAHFYVGWTSNGGTTTLLVPPGSEYIDPNRNAPYGSPVDINADGIVVGTATKFVPGYPTKSFKYVNGQYTMLGLTGPAYEDLTNGIEASTQVQGISDNNVIVGTTRAIAPGATGAWVDAGSGPVEVGLVGPDFQTPDGYLQSLIIDVSDNGIAFGISTKFRGVDNNIGIPYNGAFAVLGGTTIRIGLTDSEHIAPDGKEYNFAYKQGKDGTVLGQATRFNAASESVGVSTWVFDPARTNLGTVRVGLQGGIYQSSTGASNSYAADARDGIVTGLSYFYLPENEDIWYDGFVTDITTGETSTLRFSQSSDGRARTQPVLVTQRGGVFGYYTRFINDQIEGDRPFYWSPRAGFVDLLPTNTPSLQLGSLPELAVSPDGTRVALSGVLLTGDPTLLRITLPESVVCDSIDFNNDTSLFDPQDIEAFLSVYSEGPCIPATATCNDIDFNNDTSLFDPCDINSFLAMYSESPCTPCGE